MIAEKKKEKEKSNNQIEEKRVKPTVIRRRQAQPVNTPSVLSDVSEKTGETHTSHGPTKVDENNPSTLSSPNASIPDKRHAGTDIKTDSRLSLSQQAVSGEHAGMTDLDISSEQEPEFVKKGNEVVIPPDNIPKKDIIPVVYEAVKEKHIKKEIKIAPSVKPARKKQYEGTEHFGKKKKFEKFEKFDRIKPPTQKRDLKKTEIILPKAAKRIIKIADAISVGDISHRLGVKASDIIKKLMNLGVMATVNQFIDIDAATLVAHDFGYEVESVPPQEELLLEDITVNQENQKSRPPVVTVMGHVDHGKTSLLDAIRKTTVVEQEAGGITQHIGAYHVHLEKGDITFLDTPGHEAFTAMRARGAKVTDLVVLVVAANDGVMPQTIEAINHAKAANVPIIVAINKIDLPGADPQKIKQTLTEYGLVSEEWGGDTIFAQISAKKGIGIKELLELIILQSEVLELKANSQRPGSGVVIEAKLDKGRGPVATVLIREGTIRIGDVFISGIYSGRVRAMINDWGKKVEEAGPSMPVEILGFSGVPFAGDVFSIVKDEATARQIAAIRLKKKQETELNKTAKISLIELYEKIKVGEVKELSIVVKADVQGSVEAVKEMLTKITSTAIKINIIHSAVGGITEGDVILAAASNAIVVGFNVRPEPKAQLLAEQEVVDLRLYSIIYELADDVKKAMEGMLTPTIKETNVGKAEVREIFKIVKIGVIAGCYVTDGKITRSNMVRLIRDNVVIYIGKMDSLKRFKEDVKEVSSGYECGISIEKFNDIKIGDIIEAYKTEEVATKL